jgi:HSP20 family molecular chaperone IbpA
MKHHWTRPAALLLLVVIGVQLYYYQQQQNRIERLEAALQKYIGSEDSLPGSGQEGKSQLNKRGSKPFAGFPDDPFGFDTDPFADLESMRQRVDQIMGNAFGDSELYSLGSPLNTPGSKDTGNPKIEINEEPDRFVITVTQVDPESQNIEAKIDGKRLTLTFTTKHSSEENRSNDSGSFFGYSSSTRQFSKSVDLAAPVEVNSMQTSIEDDRITIAVKKSAVTS